MATKLDRFRKKYFNAEGLKASGPLVLEIIEERPEEIVDPKTGHPVERPVLTFVNTETRLVVNSTNWDSIEYITGSGDSRDWPGCKVELYADKTRMGGKLVDCVRVRRPNSGRSAFAQAAASPPTLSANKRPMLADAAASPSSPPADEQPAMDDEIPF
jgi:hypothetical protein